MPDVYVDRGIIKWNPFDALAGYGSMLEEMRRRRNAKERPELSEDARAELDLAFQEAVTFQKEIELRYYRKGYVLVTYGRVMSVDRVRRRITLSTRETVDADDVLGIDILS
jgi:hypothetical protein